MALTMKSDQVWVYVTRARVAGPNDMHFTALPTGGGPCVRHRHDGASPVRVRICHRSPCPAEARRRALRPAVRHPYSGKWQMTVRQLGETDEAVLVSPFSVR